MKTLLTTLFSIATFIVFGQNVGIGTTQPTEKLEVNGIIFSKTGGVKFPDGSVQTTAYTPATANQATLSGLVVEFAPEVAINIVGSANDGVITNALNVSSAQEGIAIGVSISNGTQTSSAPNFSELSISRIADVNTAQLRKLLATSTIIPYIEVYYLKTYGSTYFIDHVARYESCLISSISVSSGGDIPSEAISINYLKSCYKSYQRASNGAQMTVKEFCYDQGANTNNSNCSCVFSN
jgi:type VI secretion system secreted protein Hcp